MRRFLWELPIQARKTGERLFEEGRVEGLLRATDALGFVAIVVDESPQAVSLSYDEDLGWETTCDCAEGGDCAHTYAAMLSAMAQHTLDSVRGLSAGKQKASAKKKRRRLGRDKAQAPLSPFGKEVVRTLGRRLRPDERELLHQLHLAYQRVVAGESLTYWDLEKIGLSVGVRGWDRVQLWPTPPANEREFCSYVAVALLQREKKVPPFLVGALDMRAVREKIAAWEREKEVSRWLENLASQSRFEPSAAETLVHDLRLVLDEAAFGLEWKPPGQERFEALRVRKARDLWDEIRTGSAQLRSEAERLWWAFKARLVNGRALRIGYHEEDASEVLRPLLASTNLESRIVTPQGERFRRADEPLRWAVEVDEKQSGDYLFRLVQANGERTGKVLAALKGNPPFYITSNAIYAGPSPVWFLIKAEGEARIPAGAIESSVGLDFLRRIDVEPPAALRERTRDVRMKLMIHAELVRPYPGSPTEHCRLNINAVAEDGSHREHWTGSQWRSQQRQGVALKPSDQEEIVVYDRSALARMPGLLNPLPLKQAPAAAGILLRVSKKFPDIFVPWLKSLPEDVEVSLQGDLASLEGAEVAGRVSLDCTETEIDWFDLRVVLDVSDTDLNEEEINLLLSAKGKYVRLEEKGWRRLQFDLDEEDDEKLAKLGLNPHELSEEPQRLHALQLADDAARNFLPEDQVDQIRVRADELKARVTPSVPANITADLRPYQIEGFHFLAYLSSNHFGGILADDMGLGKTLQALAWLVWLRQPSTSEATAATGKDHGENDSSERKANAPAGSGPLPSLVVCPKSVMDNWLNEANRFVPGLRVRTWSAARLSGFFEEIDSADVHVLNYSQLRILGEALSGVAWLAVILDEGQYIKNPSSQTAQVARGLRARHRLVLSGTPIENRLLDLWSLMAFAMPGMLSSRHHFARLYDAKDDPFARQRLAARVRPFLLRRTKQQVAKDLPDRIEEDLLCEIEGEQLTLYRAELKRAQQLLLKVKTQKQLAKQQFHFLTSLLRLRQICCHPKLVKADSKAESAKVAALMDVLEPLMEEGHKVLVFSQFVELLKLLKQTLSKRGWPLHYLSGSTENRGDVVEAFQNAEDSAVFLISLKAGGFGLNLTAASYVVLFDPWWNPAVENQAIDRTHRIGQTNKVVAYRLLIKHSIEEKIRLLQKQKQALAEDVLGEERFAQSLTLDDLRFLFSEEETV